MHRVSRYTDRTGQETSIAPRRAIRLLVLSALLVAGCASRRDLTADHDGICEIHAVPMRRAVVPIAYGMVVSQYQNASAEQFSNTDDPVLGGCCVGDATQAVVFVCPRCKDAG